jgi:hypothetical protein
MKISTSAITVGITPNIGINKNARIISAIATNPTYSALTNAGMFFSLLKGVFHCVYRQL